MADDFRPIQIGEYFHRDEVDVEKMQQLFDMDDGDYEFSMSTIGSAIQQVDPSSDPVSEVLTSDAFMKAADSYNFFAMCCEGSGLRRLQDYYTQLWELSTNSHAQIVSVKTGGEWKTHTTFYGQSSKYLEGYSWSNTLQAGDPLGMDEGYRKDKARQLVPHLLQDYNDIKRVFERVWGTTL